ncbi:uncharacterized protein LOC121920224 isoform X2 [Sceloporus undulatus]|uniref:uncharacterized protein LOC121920224 isoform X2 n=1 Tax=Sceloporus undulatus TaxID=8520 RepID=UPI001C4C6152|nr:uncharacterized protein LOC121920224 isoform X2 [Sceloporus undulatus]
MWKQHFRMPYAIFNMLVKELHPHLTRRDTRLRKAVLVEKQIAMAIMYLAHKGSYATVATFFGVGKSTAYKAIIQVFLCMEMVLLRRAVYLGDYRQVGHNRREGVYNRRLSKAHCVVERSFGRLKSRFCALQCGLDLSVESIPSAILACCILHNIIETNGEVLNGQNTSPETFIIDPRRYLSDDEEKRLGEEIRDAFVEYFNS